MRFARYLLKWTQFFDENNINYTCIFHFIVKYTLSSIKDKKMKYLKISTHGIRGKDREPDISTLEY